MARISIVVGMFLSALSAVAMLTNSTKHPAQFFPLMFGIPVLICGVAGLNPHRRRFAMHIAASIALLGAVASITSASVWWGQSSRGVQPSGQILVVSAIMALTEISFVAIHLVTRYRAHWPPQNQVSLPETRSPAHQSGISSKEESELSDPPPKVPTITASHDP